MPNDYNSRPEPADGGEAEGGEQYGEVTAAGGNDIRKIADQLTKWANSTNIAPEVDPNKLRMLSMRCVEGYEIDRRSRAEWEKSSARFMEMALQKTTPKSFPWANSSNVVWPLLSQATNEFAAAIYPVIMDNDRVVKGKIVGSDKGQLDVEKAKQIVAAEQAAMMAQQQQGAASGQNMQEMSQNMQGQAQNMQGQGQQPEMMLEQQQGAAPPPDAGPPQKTPTPYLPGKEPGSKRRRADKVGEHMSYQVLVEQKEWQTDTDRMFRALPVIGCAARKSWFDPVFGRNCSMYVSMVDLVVNYQAKSLETAPRLTEVFELYPTEIEDRIRSEEFVEFTPGQATSLMENDERASAYFGDPFAPHLFLEQHCFWDMDGDGYMEPYTVTIHRQSLKIVRIVARYEVDGIHLTRKQDRIAKIEPLHYYTLYQFMPNPESAIYGHGFGHILGPINESLNSAINQMFDSGTMSIVGGGFIGTGLAMHAGQLRFKMGEFKQVNTGGAAIKDAIWQPQFQGPSPVMFQMFAMLVEAGRELAGIKQITTGQTPPASTDPATMMAMLEQGMRVFKDVYKRVLRGLNEEYSKLFALNRRWMPKQGLKYQRADEQFEVTAEDYAATSGVETVGDPSMVTDMQRMARAQVLGAFKDDPRCNGTEIIRRIFAAANIEDIDEVIVEQQGPSPMEQLQMQLLQAEVATKLVEQQKGRAQSVLYLMQARKAAAEADTIGLEAQIDAQLDREWMEIEKTNNELQGLQLVVQAHKAKSEEIKANAHMKKASQSKAA